MPSAVLPGNMALDLIPYKVLIINASWKFMPIRTEKSILPHKNSLEIWPTARNLDHQSLMVSSLLIKSNSGTHLCGVETLHKSKHQILPVIVHWKGIGEIYYKYTYSSALVTSVKTSLADLYLSCRKEEACFLISLNNKVPISQYKENLTTKHPRQFKTQIPHKIVEAAELWNFSK